MASVDITQRGVIYDLQNKTARQVVFISEAMLTGVGIGGGPVIPPSGGSPGDPPGIWGGGNVPMPNPPIANVPGLPPTQNPPGWGQHPSHPIALPGDPWWPPETPTDPPSMPPPGSPPVIIPGTTPVHPINPPAAIVVDYPGIGKVLVPQPVT